VEATVEDEVLIVLVVSCDAIEKDEALAADVGSVVLGATVDGSAEANVGVTGSGEGAVGF